MIGAAEMAAKLRAVASAYPSKLASAIYVEAQVIMTESKRRCPVAASGGTLRASGMVSEPTIDGTKVSVVMSYGGAASDYAIAVHEHLSEHSPPSWIAAEEDGMGIHWTSNGTGPKFLEQPLMEALPELPEKIANRVKF